MPYYSLIIVLFMSKSRRVNINHVGSYPKRQMLTAFYQLFKFYVKKLCQLAAMQLALDVIVLTPIENKYRNSENRNNLMAPKTVNTDILTYCRNCWH